MISKENILEIIGNKVESEGYFIVDINIKSGNKILVEIDGDNGVPIEFCVSISRLIEQSLDRDIEDFELEVSSPGLGKPLKIFRQFKKVVDKEVEVRLPDNTKVIGYLTSLDQSGFTIKTEKMVKVEGKKKKKLQVLERTFTFDEVKTVKELIKFK